MLSQLQRTIRHFQEDSLFRNATFIMTSTILMSILGFGFWVFIARLYSPTNVGIGSALISISILISNMSLLGLNSGLIRYLPRSKNPSGVINAAILTVSLAALVVSAIYAAIGHGLGVGISWFTADIWHVPIFMILMVVVALNTLTDAVFIANRKAQYHTATYAAFGVTKLLMPLAFVGFASIGIFLAYVIAVIVSLAFSVLFMWRACGYKILTPPDWRLISETRRYVTSNYIGVILVGVPAQTMPLFIIHKLGAAQAAYFALAWTMVNLIYVIPSSIAQSLLAESSHEPRLKSRNLLHAVKMLAVILIPVVILSMIIAPYLLRIFGVQYAVGSTAIFQVLALATFFVSVNTIGNTVLNVEQRASGIIAAQLVVALVTLTSVQYLIRYGLVGVGIAMMLGYASSNLIHAYLYLRHKAKAKEVYSEGHFSVDAANLRAMLAAYDLKLLKLRPLDNGNSGNINFLVTTKDREVVLRIYGLKNAKRQRVDQEVNFMNFLHKKGLPIPRIYKNIHRQFVSQFTSGKTRWLYLLMEYMPGEHPNVYSESLAKEMATIQARMHMSGLAYVRTAQFYKIKSKNRISLERLLFNLLKFPLLILLPKGLSHFDYSLENILVHNDKVSGVIDFEGIRRDYLIICIFFSLKKMYELQNDITRLCEYVASYQQVRRLGKAERFVLSGILALHFKDLKMLRLNRA